MQEELKRYSDRIRTEGRLPIQARVGVNTGEVVVQSIATGEGRSEYVPVGHSTGIAARMQALAPVGSIAATERIGSCARATSSSGRSAQPRSRELVKR